MLVTKRIKKGDLVKIISGSNKGVTGKVEAVLHKSNSVLIENVGLKKRHVKPNQLNPRGGHKDIHVPIKMSKVALVVDEKTNKTSRVGLVRDDNNKLKRIAKQLKNKEIK